MAYSRSAHLKPGDKEIGRSKDSPIVGERPLAKFENLFSVESRRLLDFELGFLG